MSKFLLTILFSFVLLPAFSQSETTSDYTPLVPTGKLPDDFLILSEDRYLQALENDPDLNYANRKVREKFHLNANFALNRLLYSGQVLFNEPSSDYVNAVADKILEKDPELREKLRFYTVKNAQANAFTTGQGVIFVTLGLIAQLENEAQLAAVLSHEIVHYTKQHSINGFEEKENILSSRKYRRMGPQNAISVLSKYSKDKEYEADVSGLKNHFLASDYDREVFRSIFDVLHYSYLPFSQTQISARDMEGTFQVFSEKILLDSLTPINVLEEDFDDSQSTHPNTYSRKLRIEDELATLAEEENNGALFLVGQEEFERIRKMARFEILRLRLQDLEYGKALYETLALQKEYPNSQYLEKAVIKALYGTAKYKNQGVISQVVQNYKDIEGASQSIHYFLRKSSKKTLTALALRKAMEYELKYPEDDYVSSLVDNLIVEIEENVKVAFSYFKTIDAEAFYAAVYPDSVETIADSLTIDALPTDSLKNKKELALESKKQLSKYEIIDQERKNIDKSKTSEGFKTTDAEFKYAFSNLILEHNLEQRWNGVMEKYYAQSQQEEDDEDYEARKLARKENKTIEKHGLALGIDSLVLVNPIVFKLDKQKNQDLIESERLQLEFESILQENADLLGMKLDSYSSKNVQRDAIESYNIMSQYTAFMNEFYNHDAGMDIIPAESDFADNFESLAGSDKVFTSFLVTGRGRKNPKIKAIYLSGIGIYVVAFHALALATLGSINPLLGAGYVFYLFRPKYYTYLNAAILDIRTGQVAYELSYDSKSKASKGKMSGLLYELLYQTHRNP